MCNVTWLLSLLIDKFVRVIKTKNDNIGMEMSIDFAKWELNTILLADCTIWLTENEKIGTVCEKRLKVTIDKSKVMAL